jgi:serine/threonine protein kinase/Flp pilus assembly protein TadD
MAVTPERRQRIEELYRYAFGLALADRRAFLEQACEGDQSLLKEVESLLAAREETGGGSITSPPEKISLETIVEDPAAIIGKLIGHYKILSLLGKGGMGEVYLAQDTKLGRKVALKFLPSSLVDDTSRLRRFEQEAYAASALNHPNILTIYEIGQIDQWHFIATEFIDGETLRQEMKSSRMKLSEVLEVAIQMASALSAAHASGVIHRDIKPENVMLSHDRIAKILDFGLAKLTPRRRATVDIETPTKTLFKTDPGTVVGTTAYMSPEQASGLPVDARTDIFSVGIVVYEMITGRLPFEGETSSAILASLLSEKEPQPLARYSREVPAELERIVSKALRKDRNERYQTTKDLLIDLKRLKQELEFAVKLERSGQPTSGKSDLAVNDDEWAAISTEQVPGARATSRATRFASQMKEHQRGAIFALILSITAIAALAYFRNSYFKPSTPITSLAVLPLANGSNDPNTDYLSDGITESIINSLSQLPDLKVMARTTVFRYKGKEVDPQKIGQELGVGAVLTGKVLQHGDTLVIQADLVRVSDGTQLWGERYSPRLSDVVAVQGEIAKEISDKLRLRLSGQERERLTKRYTDNTEAYQLYLKGRYQWNKRTVDSLEKAVDYFQQALQKDPGYALAYAGLADAYLVNSVLPPRDISARARDAALKALALDNNLAEAHASLGFVKSRYDWNWSEAQDEYQRALALNQNYSVAYYWYADLLTVLGKQEGALTQLKRAQELDPLSPTINAALDRTIFYERQYDRAIEQMRKSVELEPNFWSARFGLGLAYSEKRMYPEAIKEFQAAATLSGNSPTPVAMLGYVYAVSGRPDKARQVITQLNELSIHRYVPPYNIAVIYVGLGDKDLAFQWLEKAYGEHDPSLALLKVAPWLDSLREDPRFSSLTQRIGFPN